MARAGQDIANHVRLVVGHPSEFAVIQHLAESDDAIQRRAQFVGDAGQKRLLANVAERAASSARPSCSFLIRSSRAYCSTLRAATAARLRSVTSSRERII